jgi:hypothetical protein
MLLPLQKIEGNWKLVKTRTLRQFGELKRDIGAAELKKARQNRSPTCVKQPWMGYCWSDESEERLKLNKSLLRAPWSVVPGVAPSTAKHSQ